MRELLLPYVSPDAGKNAVTAPSVQRIGKTFKYRTNTNLR
jgi:hypothetical protein